MPRLWPYLYHLSAVGFYCLLLSSPSSLRAQDLNFKQTNYTIADGLPSNECHEMLQDSLGYLWIATDRGLVRYDGYAFTTYGIQEGLEDISCLNIVMDKEGDIWILTLSGRIYRYDSQLDEILSYPHQSILDSFLRFTKIFTFDVSKDNTLSFILESIGVIDISSDGSSEMYRGQERDSLSLVFTRETEKGLLVTVNNRIGPPYYSERQDLKRKNYGSYISEDFEIQHKEVRIKGVRDPAIDISNREAFYLPDGVVLLTNCGVDYYIEKDTVLVRMYQNEIEDIVVVNDTSFIISEVNQKGVSFYKNYTALLNNQKQTLINGISATCSLIDQDDNIWVTTTDQGLFKLERKLINSLVSSMTMNEQVTSVEQGHSTIYYILGKNSLYKGSHQNKDSLVLFDHSDRLYSLTFDNYKSELIIGKFSSERFTEENSFAPIFYLDNDSKRGVFPMTINEAFVLSNEEYVTTTAYSFMIYNDLDSLQDYNSWGSEDALRVLGVGRISKGHYLLGTVNGLLEFKNQTIHELDNRPSMLGARINDIKKLGDKYLFATIGNGLVIWDLEDNLILKTKKEGLLSNNIEQIFIDENEHIYLSTKAGLGKLWFDESDSLHIKNYTTFHGLPSNEVNDVAVLRDSLYIATGKGLAVLASEPTLADKQLIRIENIRVNGEQFQLEEEKEFSHLENSLLINYKTVDYAMEGKIPYRYKLNEGEWTETQATFANFSALSPGKYTFSVQSKNIDDIWSEPVLWAFEIYLPWWKTKRFYGLLALCLMGLGYLSYKTRTQSLKNTIRVESEIRDLERSALQAQMNPHFIFNCLNSIQKFIMLNDKENAMEYLSKFARLIRESLNASVEKKISLDNELSMLRNYLDLEKLRFKEKFDYTITLANDVIPEELSIPPLLVQPYVENAILHGINGKEQGGKIDLSFLMLSPNQLQVKIRDNGTGNKAPTEKKSHKSLGMSITSKRLAYNNNLHDSDIQIRPDYSSEGTEVVITITL